MDTPPLSDRNPVGEIVDFPLFFGTTLFGMVAIGVTISLENNAKDPKNFVSTFGVLNLGMAFVIILYSVFGFLGYWRYGPDIEDSITLNLPPEDV